MCARLRFGRDLCNRSLPWASGNDGPGTNAIEGTHISQLKVVQDFDVIVSRFVGNSENGRHEAELELNEITFAVGKK